MRIESRVAIVTGASSGIGAALAEQLAAHGVPVGLTARRAEELETLANKIRSRGGTAAVAPADAADATGTRGAIEALARALGPIDLLIANAGRGFDTPASDFSAAEAERTMQVNYNGAAYAIEAVLPAMLAAGRGHIVGISSLAAFRGIPCSGGYCASKAALSTLLESLRVELRWRGVWVTVVHPGYVRTPMTERDGYWKPFMMSAERAAAIIVRGIAARRRVVNFPWQTSLLMGLLKRLPGPIYDRVGYALMRPREEPTGAA